MARFAGSADLSAAPDRAAVGSISKQAGLSKFQVSGVGCARSEAIADGRHKPGMNELINACRVTVVGRQGPSLSRRGR
jgi:hypothetical protein